MEHSPSWEANRFSASQEIPRNLYDPNVHYRIHKHPKPVPITSQSIRPSLRGCATIRKTEDFRAKSSSLNLQSLETTPCQLSATF